MVLPSIPLLKPEIVDSSLIYFYFSPPMSSFVVVVQSLSHVRLCVTLWTTMCQASRTFTISQGLLKFMSTESVILLNQLILCHSLLLLPSIFPSIREKDSFLKSGLHIRWPKYWSFSFSISPSKEYSGLLSFRIDWFDILAVQGTLKSLLQQHNLKTSIFGVQPSLWSNSHIRTYHPKSYYLYLNVSRICPLCYITYCQHIHWSRHSLHHRTLEQSPVHSPPSISS